MGSKTKQLEIIQQRNSAVKAEYERTRSASLLKIVVIGVQSLVIVFLLWLAFVRFPQTSFLWTSDAKAVCKATKLTHAAVHHATIAQFAAEAAIGLNSYDYLNYRKFLTSAAERYLTSSGRDQFFRALDQAEIIENVKKNYFVVSSFVNNPPQIREKGFKGGVPFWVVEVPITIWYSTGPTKHPEDRVLVMTVLAIDPTRTNPEGIAIDNIVSSQRVNK